MTSRLTANLVLGCALSAVAAGCTVHTYSARPEYPSTAFASREHDRVRYETSFRTERRDRDREAYQPDHYRPAQSNVPDRVAAKPSTRPSGSTKPSRTETTAEKPRTPEKPRATEKDRDKNDERVTLAPTKPEKAPRKRAHILSFRERVELLAKQKNEEVARQERQRRARMQNVIGAAAAKND